MVIVGTAKTRPDRNLLLSMSAQALGGVVLLSGGASADAGTDVPDYVPASRLRDVVNVQLDADGNARLFLQDGRVIAVPAEHIRVENGMVQIAADQVDAALLVNLTGSGTAHAASGSSGVLLSALGGLAAAAGAAGGGGASALSAPVLSPDSQQSNDNPPSFTSPSQGFFSENGTGTAYTATANDPDNNTVSFALVGGADAGLFNINSTTGAVSFKTAPDFENPDDAGRGNTYDIVVRASDGENVTDQNVTITVTDVDEAPAFTSATTAQVEENQAVAYTALAADPEGSSLIYSLSGGDAGLFDVNSNTGVVTFKNLPDFESPADSNADNLYQITVTASDGSSVVSQNVTIAVTDVAENPPVITSAASVSVANGQTSAYTISATDPDGDALNYSISGTDALLFDVDSASGVVTFISAPDFDNPIDAGSNNVYDITVSVSDGSNVDSQSVSITVIDADSALSPVFTSSTSQTVSENQTSAYVAVANSVASAGATISYSISGTDAGLFNVDTATGEISFKSNPDFENPSDAGRNNVYDLVVTASDGSYSGSQSVAITVSDANDTGEVPENASTTIRMVSGGSYTGQVDTGGDRDWIAITLEQGETYRFDAFGTGANELIDPLIRLYDPAGTLIKENDDIVNGVERDSTLVYTAPTSGTYYLSVGAWENPEPQPGEQPITGVYTLTAQLDDGVYTNDEIADYLDRNGAGGAQWNVAPGGTLTVDLTALTADGMNLARLALQSWADVTGLVFQEVTSGAQIVFDDDEDGAFARTTNSGAFIVAAEVNISTQWLEDNSTRVDGYSYQTYIHEVGHALGLGHGGPYNGTAEYEDDAIFLNDSWQSTVMSYFDQGENTWTTASPAFVTSPQVADILAVQNMYGVSTTTRLGDTVYGFNSNADRVIYDATALTRITSYVIFDSGGNDTMDYSGSRANQVLNLNAEAYSSLQGGTGNVSIARGTVIENAIGGTGNDILIGNDANNVLTGNTGNDAFYSSGGNDTFDGGAGTDTAYFSGAVSNYSVSTNGSGETVVTDLRAGSPDGVTTLIGIESIIYGQTYVPAQGLAAPEALPDFVYFDRAYYAELTGVDVHSHDKGGDVMFQPGAISVAALGPDEFGNLISRDHADLIATMFEHGHEHEDEHRHDDEDHAEANPFDELIPLTDTADELQAISAMDLSEPRPWPAQPGVQNTTSGEGEEPFSSSGDGIAPVLPVLETPEGW